VCEQLERSSSTGLDRLPPSRLGSPLARSHADAHVSARGTPRGRHLTSRAGLLRTGLGGVYHCQRHSAAHCARLRRAGSLDGSFVRLNPSATELTTAATDAALGLLCLAVLWRLMAIPVNAAWKKALWCWVFGLLGLASVLGTVTHGLELSESVVAVLWWPLYLSLGLTVALVLVGAVHDWRGEAAARALFPWAVGIGASFSALTQLLGGAFLIFVVYEAAAMVAALAMYAFLSTTGRLAGAGIIAVGSGDHRRGNRTEHRGRCGSGEYARCACDRPLRSQWVVSSRPAACNSRVSERFAPRVGNKQVGAT
jgi:hypothetical protein